MRKFTVIAVALLLAGSFFLSCGFGGKVRKGVTVDGVAVGGLPYAEAEERVRKNYAPPVFCVSSEEETLQVTLDTRDNVSELVRKAKRGESLTSTRVRDWATAETEIEALCKKNAIEPQNATLIFTPQGKFVYTQERAGRACLLEETLRRVRAAIAEGRESETLVTREVLPAITVQTLKERTKKLSSFTTYFDGTNTARSHNIALAALKISGTVLGSGEEFSFNETVGSRTAENGFGEAAVIFDGEFVQGVGGGVCQASTTLMNAVVRAGLKVTESRPHSLSVGYVAPSCDAMVSEYSDFKFENPYPFPVYIAAKVTSSSVGFTVYGKPNGRRYTLESRVLLRLAPPPEEIVEVEGEEEKIVRAAKDGLISESYLLEYEGDLLIGRTLFRRDKYAVVQGIRQKPPQKTEEIPEEEEIPRSEQKIG